MSPVLILSRLCLNRRFQFFGISETSSRSTSRTLFTVSSSITRRRPARAAFAEDLHVLLLEDLAGAVMGVHDVVAKLELDVLDLARDLDLLAHGCFFRCLCGNGVLLRFQPAAHGLPLSSL